MEGRFLLKGSSRLLIPQITNLLAQFQLLYDKGLGNIYGIPTVQYQSDVYFHPQIELYFVHQKPEDVSENANQKEGYHGEIKIRLGKESSTTITKTEAINLAKKVKSKFMEPPFLWRKGKVMCTYTDREKYYKLQIQARDEFEGRKVVEQVLDIQSHSPDWEKFTFTKNAEPLNKYPEIPDKKVIMGELVPIPKKRPNIDVYFRHAVLHVYGLPKPLLLCDRSNKMYRSLGEALADAS
jgi:hypothetical protein